MKDDERNENTSKEDHFMENNKHVGNADVGIPIHWIYRNRWRTSGSRFRRKVGNILSTRVGMVEISKNEKDGEGG